MENSRRTMPIISPKIPSGLEELMRGLAKSVIKENPENIYEFAAEYFENLLKERDGTVDQSYKKFATYKVYKKNKAEGLKRAKKTSSDVSKCYVLNEDSVNNYKTQKCYDESAFIEDEIFATETPLPLQSPPLSSDQRIYSLILEKNNSVSEIILSQSDDNADKALDNHTEPSSLKAQSRFLGHATRECLQENEFEGNDDIQKISGNEKEAFEDPQIKLEKQGEAEDIESMKKNDNELGNSENVISQKQMEMIAESEKDTEDDNKKENIKSEENDVTNMILDDAIEQAALKIQATFRGFKVRKDLKEISSEKIPIMQNNVEKNLYQLEECEVPQGDVPENTATKVEPLNDEVEENEKLLGEPNVCDDNEQNIESDEQKQEQMIEKEIDIVNEVKVQADIREIISSELTDEVKLDQYKSSEFLYQSQNEEIKIISDENNLSQSVHQGLTTLKEKLGVDLSIDPETLSSDNSTEICNPIEVTVGENQEKPEVNCEKSETEELNQLSDKIALRENDHEETGDVRIYEEPELSIKEIDLEVTALCVALTKQNSKDITLNSKENVEQEPNQMDDTKNAKSEQIITYEEPKMATEQSFTDERGETKISNYKEINITEINERPQTEVIDNRDYPECESGDDMFNEQKHEDFANERENGSDHETDDKVEIPFLEELCLTKSIEKEDQEKVESEIQEKGMKESPINSFKALNKNQYNSFKDDIKYSELKESLSVKNNKLRDLTYEKSIDGDTTEPAQKSLQAIHDEKNVQSLIEKKQEDFVHSTVDEVETDAIQKSKATKETEAEDNKITHVEPIIHSEITDIELIDEVVNEYVGSVAFKLFNDKIEELEHEKDLVESLGEDEENNHVETIQPKLNEESVLPEIEKSIDLTKENFQISLEETQPIYDEILHPEKEESEIPDENQAPLDEKVPQVSKQVESFPEEICVSKERQGDEGLSEEELSKIILDEEMEDVDNFKNQHYEIDLSTLRDHQGRKEILHQQKTENTEQLQDEVTDIVEVDFAIEQCSEEIIDNEEQGETDQQDTNANDEQIQESEEVEHEETDEGKHFVFYVYQLLVLILGFENLDHVANLCTLHIEI